MRLGLAMILVAAGMVVAGTLVAHATPAAQVSRLPALSGPTLIVPVQSRICRSCRNACSYERRYCGYSNYCRQSFTLCMRACWENYCR